MPAPSLHFWDWNRPIVQHAVDELTRGWTGGELNFSSKLLIVPTAEAGRRLREALALIVHGRIYYEIMEEYWPRAHDDATAPDFIRAYGEIWTAKPKVLVSRTRGSADHNTRIIGGDDAIQQLAALRAETDGVIGVGGATLATQLLRAGLLDELLLATHPAILGFGRPLFDDCELPIDLELLEQRSFEEDASPAPDPRSSPRPAA